MSNRAACASGMLCVERSGTDDIQANEVPSDEEFPLDYGDNFLHVAVNAFVPNVLSRTGEYCRRSGHIHRAQGTPLVKNYASKIVSRFC